MKPVKLIAMINRGDEGVYHSSYIDPVPVLGASKEEFLFELELAFETAIKKIEELKRKIVAHSISSSKIEKLKESEIKLFIENNIKNIEIEKEIKKAHEFCAGSSIFNVSDFISEYVEDISKAKFEAPTIYLLDEWFELGIKRVD